MHDEEFESPDRTDNAMATPILTDEDVEQWRGELSRIDAEIARLNEKKSLIQSVLSSIRNVEILKGTVGRLNVVEEVETLTATGTVRNPDQISLIDAIPVALQAGGRAMSPAEIKVKLHEIGYTKKPGTGYFYTALGRAAEKGDIVRVGDKRYAHPSLVKPSEVVPATGDA